MVATVVLPMMAATVDEYVRGGDSLKGGHAPLQRRLYPGTCAPAVLCGVRLRSGMRVATGWIKSVAERRCARTAPCIENEIDRYH